MPRKTSPLSEYLMAGEAGKVLGPSRSRPARAVTGLGVGRGIASDSFQDLLAGQAQWQKDLRKALEQGDYARVTQILSRQAAISGSGGEDSPPGASTTRKREAIEDARKRGDFLEMIRLSNSL
jgi:hypothetical protein